jgi:hypothetical protein
MAIGVGWTHIGSGGSVDSYRSDYVDPYHYSATAPLGSLDGAPVWLITRTLVNVDFTVTNTTATNVAWDDRLTATYT